MRFLDLHIKGFGKFHDTSVSFENGINVIYGKNEAGKSTIHTFIRGMLFGIERQRGRAARNDMYSKYEPWENSGTYEGSLRLESDGVIYRMERSFQKNKKEFTIINETTGREVEASKALMDELLCGLSETAYNNTISIGQLKCATEDGMISELKNYIANMNTSGNMALNITKASTYLKNQKKRLESQMMPEAARTYTSLLGEIRTLEKEIASPEFENQMLEFNKRRREVKEEIEFCQDEKAELADKVERGRQVLEEFDLSDEASVADCLGRAEAVYQDYKDAQEFVQSGFRRAVPAGAFLLMVLGLLGTAYYGYQLLFPGGFVISWLTALSDPIVGVSGLGAVSLFLFFVLFYFIFRMKRKKKALALCQATLSQLLKCHLGDASISDGAMEALCTRLGEFARLCQMLARSEATIKEQNERISSLREKQNSCSEIIERQQRIQWELEKKLEYLTDCKDRAAAMEHVIAENDRIRQELESIDLAQETMNELSMSIRDSFGLYLNKTASGMISGITGGAYSSVSIDENLNAFLNTKRKLIPLEQVSSGTADQIYLALRLASALLIQGKSLMPLIFDDSFALYDDDRLETALKWLANSYKGQLIIFTCHRREEKALARGDIKFHLISIG